MSLYHKMTSDWNQPDKVAIVFDNREWTLEPFSDMLL